MGNLVTAAVTISGVLIGTYFISRKAAGRVLMGIKADYEGLKTDIENMKTALNGALERIDAKVTELGEPDPDLGAIRSSIQAETARMSNILAAPSTGGTGTDTGEASPGGFVEPGTSDTTGVITGDEAAPSAESGGGE